MKIKIIKFYQVQSRSGFTDNFVERQDSDTCTPTALYDIYFPELPPGTGPKGTPYHRAACYLLRSG